MPENRYFLGYYDLRYVVSKEHNGDFHLLTVKNDQTLVLDMNCFAYNFLNQFET